MRKNIFLVAGISVGIAYTGFIPVSEAIEIKQGAEEVVEADIERRDVRLPEINPQDTEIGFFAGVLSIENFGTQSVIGLRAAYHITEDFFAEGIYAQSSISDEVFRKEGFPPKFANETEDIDFFNLSIGVNLFPGETFIAGKWVVGSAVYVKGGIGSINLVNDDRLTFNFGLGLRLLLNDWLAFHIDMEDMVFESELLAGQNSFTHNFQLNTGLTVFF